jgi:hypothetical protein
VPTEHTEDTEGEREGVRASERGEIAHEAHESTRMGRVSRRGAEAQRKKVPTEHTEDTEGERESVRASERQSEERVPTNDTNGHEWESLPQRRGGAEEESAYGTHGGHGGGA